MMPRKEYIYWRKKAQWTKGTRWDLRFTGLFKSPKYGSKTFLPIDDFHDDMMDNLRRILLSSRYKSRYDRKR